MTPWQARAMRQAEQFRTGRVVIDPAATLAAARRAKRNDDSRRIDEPEPAK